MEELLDMKVDQYRSVILEKVIPIGFCRFQDYDTSNQQKRIALAFEDFCIYEIEEKTLANLDDLRIGYVVDIFISMKYNLIFNSVEEVLYDFCSVVNKL